MGEVLEAMSDRTGDNAGDFSERPADGATEENSALEIVRAPLFDAPLC